MYDIQIINQSKIWFENKLNHTLHLPVKLPVHGIRLHMESDECQSPQNLINNITVTSGRFSFSNLRRFSFI